MPIHDWTRVEAGIFHDFRHSWVEELQRALNARVLPPDCYAMAEQVTVGFGPDLLALQGFASGNNPVGDDQNGSWPPMRRPPVQGMFALAEPKLAPSGETDMEFYRRKAASVTVRHVSDDRVVAIVEVVSPGNKHSQVAIEQFVRKAAFLLDQKIHLMILDLLPPGPRDPNGIHALIWDAIDGRPLPKQERPLTLASYETDETIRAFVVPAAVGDRLTDMPLFLLPRGCVEVPLEETYQAAFDVFPRRWKPRLEG